MKRTEQSITRAIQATQRICLLPAIPTHNWATDLADALADLSPALSVGVLIAHIDPQTQSVSPICAAVGHVHNTQSTADVTHQSLYLQDRLHRLTSLGCDLPDEAFDRGLIAPLFVLHPHWPSTPIGRIFANSHLQSPILMIVPFAHDHPGYVLILTLAFEKDAHASKPTDQTHATLESTSDIIDTLAALFPLIKTKAHLALNRVTDHKAWLTDREQEILDHLILGHSVRVIAERLGRSAHTVHDHVKNLHKKLDASSRGELIAKALGHQAPDTKCQTTEPIILTGETSLAELKPIREQASKPKLHARPLNPAAEQRHHSE
jgi:DNA-binding CsgD family transcriptional regulator